jgi:hypothetical protein
MQTPADEQRTFRHGAFPAEAVTWLVGGSERTVVSIAHRELATALAAAGHHVAAVPSRATPLPFPERTLDVVVATDELPTDLDRVADLLRPGGRLTLVCQQRDQRIPWARKLDRLLGGTPAADPSLGLVTSSRFGFVEDKTFRYWQVVNHDSLATMLREELAGLDPAAREEKVASALELYADYGRGNDGMQMPWVARCYKATLIDRIWATPPDEAGSAADGDAPDALDDAMLLIDFR